MINIEHIAAIELMTACQALDMHRPLKSTTILENLYSKVRERVPQLKTDFVFYEYFENVKKWLSKTNLQDLQI